MSLNTISKCREQLLKRLHELNGNLSSSLAVREVTPEEVLLLKILFLGAAVFTDPSDEVYRLATSIAETMRYCVKNGELDATIAEAFPESAIGQVAAYRLVLRAEGRAADGA